jgi:hypothetical protein
MSQFGFGRRTCQGVDIVEQELFLAMGGLAWAFNITGKKDAFGRDLYIPSDKYTSLLIAKPVEFEFDLNPVSNERMEMVEKMWRETNGGQVEDLPEEKPENRIITGPSIVNDKPDEVFIDVLG